MDKVLSYLDCLEQTVREFEVSATRVVKRSKALSEFIFSALKNPEREPIDDDIVDANGHLHSLQLESHSKSKPTEVSTAEPQSSAGLLAKTELQRLQAIKQKRQLEAELRKQRWRKLVLPKASTTVLKPQTAAGSGAAMAPPMRTPKRRMVLVPRANSSTVSGHTLRDKDGFAIPLPSTRKRAPVRHSTLNLQRSQKVTYKVTRSRLQSPKAMAKAMAKVKVATDVVMEERFGSSTTTPFRVVPSSDRRHAHYRTPKSRSLLKRPMSSLSQSCSKNRSRLVFKSGKLTRARMPTVRKKLIPATFGEKKTDALIGSEISAAIDSDSDGRPLVESRSDFPTNDNVTLTGFIQQQSVPKNDSSSSNNRPQPQRLSGSKRSVDEMLADDQMEVEDCMSDSLSSVLPIKQSGDKSMLKRSHVVVGTEEDEKQANGGDHRSKRRKLSSQSKEAFLGDGFSPLVPSTSKARTAPERMSLSGLPQSEAGCWKPTFSLASASTEPISSSASAVLQKNDTTVDILMHLSSDKPPALNQPSQCSQASDDTIEAPVCVDKNGRRLSLNLDDLFADEDSKQADGSRLDVEVSPEFALLQSLSEMNTNPTTTGGIEFEGEPDIEGLSSISSIGASEGRRQRASFIPIADESSEQMLPSLMSSALGVATDSGVQYEEGECEEYYALQQIDCANGIVEDGNSDVVAAVDSEPMDLSLSVIQEEVCSGDSAMGARRSMELSLDLEDANGDICAKKPVLAAFDSENPIPNVDAVVCGEVILDEGCEAEDESDTDSSSESALNNLAVGTSFRATIKDRIERNKQESKPKPVVRALKAAEMARKREEEKERKRKLRKEQMRRRKAEAQLKKKKKTTTTIGRTNGSLAKTLRKKNTTTTATSAAMERLYRGQSAHAPVPRSYQNAHASTAGRSVVQRTGGKVIRKVKRKIVGGALQRQKNAKSLAKPLSKAKTAAGSKQWLTADTVESVAENRDSSNAVAAMGSKSRKAKPLTKEMMTQWGLERQKEAASRAEQWLTGGESRERSPEYAISDYDSEFEESSIDEDNCDKHIPTWARGAAIGKLIRSQAATDPDDIFGKLVLKTCDLEEVFRGYPQKEKYRKRSPSGEWRNDRVTFAEELSYKQDMGWI